jgi:cob(I)alamin adenosyltransferase
MKNNDEKGLVIVYTGNGKGKSTAAFGLCLRAIGHGNKIQIIQFIKSDWDYGELRGLERLAPEVSIKTMGAGCIGILGDDKPREEHLKAAREAFDAAQKAVSSKGNDIVILDEINISVHLGLIDSSDVLDLISGKPENLDLVLTGRYATEDIIDRADLVTEMLEIKHPFQKGILAKKGIDY